MLRPFLLMVLAVQLSILSVELRPGHGSNLTFGPPINLSNDPTDSATPEIAASGNNVYVVWLNNTLGNSDILFSASTNNGTSFGKVVNLSSNPLGDSADPQVTSAGGNVYVVWQESNSSVVANQVYFRASTDSGSHFGKITNLSQSTQDSTFPQLAATGNNVTVVWQTASTTHNDPFDIDYRVSTNNGASFSTIINLSSNTGTSESPQISISGRYVYVTWEDNNKGTFRTFFARSTNDGVSFGAPADLSVSSVTGETDFYQQIAAAGSDVYVAWYNNTLIAPTNLNDSIFFTASTNNGGTFGTPVRLSAVHHIAIDPHLEANASNVYLAWTDTIAGSSSQAYYRASSNNGASFSPAVNLSNDAGPASTPRISATGSNVYIAWDDGSSVNNEIAFVSSSDSGVTFGTTQVVSNTLDSSKVPVTASAGSNAYIAWQDDSLGSGDILFSGTVANVPYVAITGVSLCCRTFAYAGVTNVNPIVINVTLSNLGPVTTSFVVSARANSTFPIPGNQSVTLPPGGATFATFTWDTSSLKKGNYNVTAYISQVSPAGQTNLSRNTVTWTGPFQIKLAGDANGDCKVNIFDLTSIGGVFGSSIGQAGYAPAADINSDGKINIFDLTTVGANFGAQCQI